MYSNLKIFNPFMGGGPSKTLEDCAPNKLNLT